MDITYQYIKKRCDFGRQTMFCEQGPDMCDSITTDVSLHKNFILRNPVHQLSQFTPCFSQHEINTYRADSENCGINHAEGGWPKDVVVTDPEATQRYRRRVEKEDNYINCVTSAAPAMEHYVLQNNAIDMYCTYYADMKTEKGMERSSCRTLNVYRDADERPVSSVSWQPQGGNRFAVTYVDMDFDRKSCRPTFAYIWDLRNSNEPETSLMPPCSMPDLQFSPRDENLLVGALVNGQVTAFDRRRGANPIATIPPHVAHRDLVRKVLFISTKSGQEFFSSGPDGVCKWWDLRNFEAPTDEMIMDVVKSSFDVQSMANSNGVSVLEYEPTIQTRFMVGTENGFVLGCNRKGKTPMEKISVKYEAHLGPVWSIERNPCFLKNFLTVGDWTARVWTEECRESALLWTAPHRNCVTAGTWSPTRISLLELVSKDGKLALWDLLQRQHEPVVTMQVCQEPLLQIQAHEAIFDRECKREKILEARLREIKLKQKMVEEGSITVEDAEDPSSGDKDLIEATNDYMHLVKKELAAIAL